MCVIYEGQGMNLFRRREQKMNLLSCRNIICITALALCLATVAPWASANIIPPGTSGGTPDFPLNPVGTQIADTGVLAFANAPVSGTIREVVIRDTATGFLDFEYAIHNTGDIIEHSSTFDYTGFITDVGYSSSTINLLGDLSSIVPLTVDRSPSGGTVSFDFGLPFAAGLDSFNLVIETNALYYTGGNLSVIDGATATVRGFAPTAAPEPASLALMGTGIVFCARLLRRKKKNAVAAIAV
jgi:PEP-CTERM motif